MQPVTKSLAMDRIAFIGNHLPRKCGIATFTTDLSEAFAAEFPAVNCLALAVNDTPDGYAYPPRVRFEIAEKEFDSYRRAADFLNLNNIDLVCLQHEYGIYGGRLGSHILGLLRELRTPVVTTLHTVLRDPDPDQRWVLEQIAALSDRLVVMSERAAEFLHEIYRVPLEKIDYIPHGIPDVPFVDPAFYKDQFGVEGRTVLLTFGLLSPNKGIENMISALPAVLEKHPDVVYIVLGATHPQVRRHDGETYRLSLKDLAREKGVEKQVVFYDQFVSLDELVHFIGAADIYITPYLNQAQIVSGTLAYTLGAGKAVVSTTYWYAEEMLAEERGVLVPFRDPAALADGVNALLKDDAGRNAMRKRAYLHGREMVWPQVVQRYMQSFERARLEHHTRSQPGFSSSQLHPSQADLPELTLDHLHQMTDDTGMLQHANCSVPNYNEGYCTDDNARALIVSALLQELGNPQAPALASRYLAFLSYAFNPQTGRMRNFMDFQRHWLEKEGSADSHGRALWALGTVLGRLENPSFQGVAGRLFEQALPAALETTAPRTWAFTILGLHEYLQRFGGDRLASQALRELSRRLMNLYKKQSQRDWRWFEDCLTYCNATLPHALLLAGRDIPDRSMTETALDSLEWLTSVQLPDGEGGAFAPIGSDGFYPRGGTRARFDQQPVEAQAMISACLEAWRTTGDLRWHREAGRTFEWFLGRNDLSLQLYDPLTGGCRDGLHPDRANDNEGAESTLAFLQARLELQLAQDVLQSVEAHVA